MKKSDIFGILSIYFGGLPLVIAIATRGILYLCIENHRNGWFIILGHIFILLEIALSLFLPLLSLGGFSLGVIGIFTKDRKWLYILSGLLLNGITFVVGLFLMKEYNAFFFS